MLQLGKPLTVACKLFALNRMCSCNDAEIVSDDPKQFVLWLKCEYSSKYGTDRKQQLNDVWSFVELHEHDSLEFDTCEIDKAFPSIRKTSRLDHFNVCIAGLYCYYVAFRERFCHILNTVCTCTEDISDFYISGFVKAKQQGKVNAKQTRVLLPLPCVLQLIDLLLTARLQAAIERRFGSFLLSLRRTVRVGSALTSRFH